MVGFFRKNFFSSLSWKLGQVTPFHTTGEKLSFKNGDLVADSPLDVIERLFTKSQFYFSIIKVIHKENSLSNRAQSQTKIMKIDLLVESKVHQLLMRSYRCGEICRILFGRCTELALK